MSIFKTPFPLTIYDFKNFKVELYGYTIQYVFNDQCIYIPTDFQITLDNYNILTLENSYMRFTDIFPFYRKTMFERIALLFLIKLPNEDIK